MLKIIKYFIAITTLPIYLSLFMIVGTFIGLLEGIELTANTFLTITEK